MHTSALCFGRRIYGSHGTVVCCISPAHHSVASRHSFPRRPAKILYIHTTSYRLVHVHYYSIVLEALMGQPGQLTIITIACLGTSASVLSSGRALFLCEPRVRKGRGGTNEKQGGVGRIYSCVSCPPAMFFSSPTSRRVRLSFPPSVLFCLSRRRNKLTGRRRARHERKWRNRRFAHRSVYSRILPYIPYIQANAFFSFFCTRICARTLLRMCACRMKV